MSMSSFLPVVLMAALESGTIRCNLEALSKEERALHGRMTRAIAESVREQVELPRGFRWRFVPGETSPALLVEWIGHERRCCPFLRFQVEFEPEGGAIWLTLTGPEGAKEILREAFARRGK